MVRTTCDELPNVLKRPNFCVQDATLHEGTPLTGITTRIATPEEDTPPTNTTTQIMTPQEDALSTSITTRPTTLHQFPRFPRELRDMIWKFAIRHQGERGVHVFTFFNGKTEKEKIEWSKHCVVVNRQGTEVALAAPTLPDGWEFPSSYRRVLQPSWYRSNPSTYLIDGGLWTACKESREIMEKHFSIIPRFQIERPRLSSELVESYLDMDLYLGVDLGTVVETIDSQPATAFFTHNGTTQSFTVYPMTDLFIIQDYKLANMDLSDMFNHVPLFEQNMGNFASHIAFELGPWYKGRSEEYFALHRVRQIMHHVKKSRQALVKYSRFRNCRTESPENGTSIKDYMDTTRLWFIDRSPAALSEGASSDRQGQFVFFASDCKYVEVGECADHNRSIIPSHPLLSKLKPSTFNGPWDYWVRYAGNSPRWDAERFGVLRPVHLDGWGIEGADLGC